MATPVDGQKLTSLVNNIEIEYLNGFKPQASVSNPTQYSLKMSSSFSFSIKCITDSGYYTGHSTGDSYSSTDCSAKIDRFVQLVNGGFNPNVSQALKHDVKNRPLYLYNNRQTYDSVKHTYCEACSSCSGSGRNTCYNCTGGYTSCSRCSSGYTSCYSCSGAGYRWENNRQVSCGQCSGGQQRCHTCSGSGRTTCNSCSGRGEIDCSPCAATGYFTYWMSAAACSRAEQSCQWDANEVPSWVNGYIQKTLSSQTHIPINRAVPWRFAGAAYQLEHMPFTVQVEGALIAMDADVTIDAFSEKGLFLMPDTLEIWSLHNALDQSASNINDYIHNNLNADTLKKYLHTRVALYALESVNKPSALPAPLAAPQLMSEAGFNQVKATIIHSAKTYDKVRNLVSVGRWAKESILCSSILLALVFAVNFLHPEANSEGLGLAFFFTGLPTTLEILHELLMGGLGLPQLLILAGTMGMALLLMTVLGSGRAWSRFRLSYWFVISTFITIGLFGQLSVAFSQPVAAHWWAFNLIPDVALCGVLAGLFRARRYVFKNIGREVTKIGSDTFARMLNYKE